MYVPARLPTIITKLAAALIAAVLTALMHAGAASADCANPSTALGVKRIVEIDATGGPLYGSITHQHREPSFLKAKEVVLTFDDGPMPWVTKSILNTLDLFCTKATFFSVGRMALAYPATVKDVLARGHTLGSHTYTHPFRMPRMPFDTAMEEVERGFAAVTTAAGQPIAPFFRFPGLADGQRLLAYLKARNMASFTVDVVSNDSYIQDPKMLADRTMDEIERRRGGIILFHDIKTTTAKALPDILARLKEAGYTVVHMTAKPGAEPMPSVMAAVAQNIANLQYGDANSVKAKQIVTGSIATDKLATVRRLEVKTLNAGSIKGGADRPRGKTESEIKSASEKKPPEPSKLASSKPEPTKSEKSKSETKSETTTVSIASKSKPSNDEPEPKSMKRRKPAADRDTSEEMATARVLKPTQVEPDVVSGPPVFVQSDVELELETADPHAGGEWSTEVRQQISARPPKAGQ